MNKCKRGGTIFKGKWVEFKLPLYKSGVYLISFTHNNKKIGYYIGMSKNLRGRESGHYSEARRLNKNVKNYPLYKAMNNYSFSFEVLELCDEMNMETIEEKYINEYRNKGLYLFNISSKGNATSGKQKIRVLDNKTGETLYFESMLQVGKFLNISRYDISQIIKKEKTYLNYEISKIEDIPKEIKPVTYENNYCFKNLVYSISSENVAGVYGWVVDGDLIYIGESRNLRNRERSHINSALRYRLNPIMFNSKQKWTECSKKLYDRMLNATHLEFRIIEIVNDVSLLANREEYWINYFRTKNNTLLKENISGKGNRSKKAIDMYSVNGEYIRSFNSGVEAEIVTGISRKHISSCCNGGNIHQYNGFVFRLKGDAFNKYRVELILNNLPIKLRAKNIYTGEIYISESKADMCKYLNTTYKSLPKTKTDEKILRKEWIISMI